jgi:enamine deaminase RidA (YjgF/YER057c/UK114 family)
MERRIINPWTWTDHYGVAQAVEITGASRTLICSGQIAVDAEGHPLHAGDMKAQLKLALDNLETVLRQADFTFSDVVRLNVYTTHMDAFVAEVAESGILDVIRNKVSCMYARLPLGQTRSLEVSGVDGINAQGIQGIVTCLR